MKFPDEVPGLEKKVKIAMPGGGGGKGDPENDLDADAVDVQELLRMGYSDQVPVWLKREELEKARIANEGRSRITFAGRHSIEGCFEDNEDLQIVVADSMAASVTSRTPAGSLQVAARFGGGVTCHVQPNDCR